MRRRKVLNAYHVLKEFNACPVKEINWSVYFAGKEAELEKCIDDFSSAGLNNIDLITGNFTTKYDLKKMYKL